MYDMQKRIKYPKNCIKGQLEIFVKNQFFFFFFCFVLNSDFEVLETGK